MDELLYRGHSVVGISRMPPKSWEKPGDYASIPCDFRNVKDLSKILSNGCFDTVVSAFTPPLGDLKSVYHLDVYHLDVEGHGNIKMAIQRTTYHGPFISFGIKPQLPTKTSFPF